LQLIYTAEIATPEPALSGSEGARNDREGSHHEAHPPFAMRGTPPFCHCEAQRAEAIPRSERMNQAGTKIPGTKF
jgi:hypothetical protein